MSALQRNIHCPKATTKYCSLKCAQRNYKLREQKKRINKSNDDNVKILQADPVPKEGKENKVVIP